MKNFRTYQLALALVRSSRAIHLTGCYRDQLQRAVLSIALNLAEGSAKGTPADRKRFYLIALGSLRETQSLIEILDLKPLRQPADELGASLYRLTRSI